MKKLIVFFIAISIGGVFVGCDQSGDSAEKKVIKIHSKNKESHNTQKEAVNKKAAEEDYEGLHVVEIKGMKYIPSEIVVSAGDTVIWVNKDISVHDVADEKEGLWSSPKLNRGDTWKSAFSETTEYYCSLHKVMKGKVIVR